MEGEDRFRVVVAGGGVAGLEALLALRDLAGERVALTLLTPEEEFVYRPMAVAEPFSRGSAARHPLARIAGELGAELVGDALASVEPAERTAVTDGGARLSYDALLVAVGARSVPAYEQVLTWTPELDPDLFAGLRRDLEEGYTKRLAFIVPPGVAWALPAYELALMTAWEAWGMGQEDVEVTVYTPEDAPLGIFGVPASAGLRDDLEEAGVQVRTGSYVEEREGRLVIRPGDQPLDAQRTVALPQAAGPDMPGLRADARGFVLCDRFGRVAGAERVWAAGDAISFPVKQGGLAAQQADAAAEAIAAAAGADVDPEPFRPVLRGMMLTGRGSRWMRHEPAGAGGEGDVSRRSLWWPPTKIAGRYLSPYLARLDGAEAVEDAERPAGAPVELDLERDLPAAADALRQAEARGDERQSEIARRRAAAREEGRPAASS